VIAWIVGASGTWGRAVASELMARSFDIVALGRSDVPDMAAEAARLGRSWSYAHFDLETTDPADVGIAAAEVEARAGPPDLLVVCAVVVDRDRETVARANYLVPAALIEAVAAAMGKRGSGRIGVFLAQNARLGMAGLGGYSAAQGALWTWCEAYSADLAAAGRGVTLTRVIPPRAASATQRWVSAQSGRSARLHRPDPRGIVGAILAGKRRCGRRPVLAALAMLVR
jgi:3-oxoacyl-[acyl-carrier protein] reductase